MRRQSYGSFETLFLLAVSGKIPDGTPLSLATSLAETGHTASSLRDAMVHYALTFGLPPQEPTTLQECLDAFWEAYCNKAATVA